MFQEAGLSLPRSCLAEQPQLLGFAIFVVSHLDSNSIHRKRGHSNRNEVGLKCYIFVLQWIAK